MDQDILDGYYEELAQLQSDREDVLRQIDAARDDLNEAEINLAFVEDEIFNLQDEIAQLEAKIVEGAE